MVEVAWGGAVGAYDDGGRAAVAATSSGDRRIDLERHLRDDDAERATASPDPSRGPVGPWSLGARAGDRHPELLTSVGDMYADPFADRWPGFDPAHVGYVFTLRLAPDRPRRW